MGLVFFNFTLLSLNTKWLFKNGYTYFFPFAYLYKSHIDIYTYEYRI